MCPGCVTSCGMMLYSVSSRRLNSVYITCTNKNDRFSSSPMMHIYVFVCILCPAISVYSISLSSIHDYPSPANFSATRAIVSVNNYARETTTIDIVGPTAAEDDIPSPFLRYKLDVVFSRRQTGNATLLEEVVVPGFFAADGNAAETYCTYEFTYHAVYGINDCQSPYMFMLRLKKLTDAMVART